MSTHDVRTPGAAASAAHARRAAVAARRARADAAAQRAAADLARTRAPADAAAALAAAAERATALQHALAPTAAAAARIHTRVESLRDEHARVCEAIRWAEGAAALKRALAALAAAIERADWAAAAAHCSAADAVDPAIRTSTFAAHAVPTAALPAPPPAALERLRATLVDALAAEFERATAPETADEAHAQAVLALFAPAGAHERGLAAYAAFAASRVRAVTHEVHTRLGAPAGPLFFATLLGALFEQLAMFIDKHQPLVDAMFGAPARPGFAARVLPPLRSEWSATALAVIAAWRSHRGLRRLAVQAEAHPFAALADVRTRPYEPGGAPRPVTPPPAVDGVLAELAYMAAQWSLFARFIHRRLGAPPTSELDTAMGTLLRGEYVALETFCLRAGIDKAHALDTPEPDAAPLGTSLCDDVFFVVRASLVRTLSTCSLDALEGVVERAVRMLEHDVIEPLVLRMDACRRTLDVQRLVDGPRKLAALREVRTVMATYLNALDTAAAYTDRLIKDTSDPAYLEQYFDADTDDELARAQELVRRLGTLTHKLRSAVHFEMEELFAAVIAPRLDGLRAALHDNYRLDEPAYALANEHNALPKRFAAAWAAAMGSLHDTLTSANYSLAFGLAADAAAAAWEDVALTQQYTELGALRFDKDIRAVLAQLTEHAPLGVRDRFARLQQIAYTLNADDDGDVYALGVAVGLSWQFTRDEVQSIRALRL